MLSIFRVTNKESLYSKPLRDLFISAFDKSRMDGEIVHDTIYYDVDINRNVILAGMEDYQFRALAILLFPTSLLMPDPQVYHFYNSGTPDLRKALVRSVVDELRNSGYGHMVTADWNNRGKAFQRLFKHAGNVEPQAMMYRIEV